MKPLDDNYILKIDKAVVAELPTETYCGRIHVIDTLDKVKAAIADLASSKAIGFDTETRPSFYKGSKHNVALIQLSTETDTYLFRINKIGFVDDIRDLLSDPGVLKIGVSVHDDINGLHRYCDFDAEGFVELQTMVKQYHIAEMSLQKIYGIIFGRRISKSQRLTNWEAPTLTDPQKAYAALDAKASLDIYNYLIAGKFDPAQSEYIYEQPEEDA